MVIETKRLRIREFTLADAAFILELLNEPAFIEFIGDKGVRDIAGAEKYLRDSPLASYAKHGFGLWCVTLKDGTPIGSCGLLQREFLVHPDLGYAFLARHRGQGYAHEAALAVLRHAREQLKYTTLHAITAFKNPASVGLLVKLGFDFVRFFEQPGHTEPSRLFVLESLDSSPTAAG
jgi:RimJ/RimL family protein N-acetyltransferase